MKRIILTIISMVLLLSLASCGGSGDSGTIAVEKVTQNIAQMTDAQGTVSEDIEVATEDSTFLVAVDAGTTALDKDGKPLEEIQINPAKNVPDPIEDHIILSSVDLGPDGATFDSPVAVVLSYDPAALPAALNPNDLAIAWYDEDQKEWVQLSDCIVDTNAHTVLGYVNHFTLFAIQYPDPEQTDSIISDQEPYHILSSLSLDLPEIIGKKTWVIGYYGNTDFATDGLGFLVEDFNDLLTEKQLPRYSFARLDGTLPPDDLTGSMILAYGEISEYGEQYGAFVVDPTPLITVEAYVLFDDATGQLNGEEPWYDFVTGDTGASEPLVLAASFLNNYASSFAGIVSLNDPLRIPEAAATTPPPTQASGCDRVLVICGGIDVNNYQPRYTYNAQQRFNKLESLGFSDSQIDILQYDGSAINVDRKNEDGSTTSKNIVDGPCTLENIRKAIQKYMDEMPASCTLLVFVDDHGCGYTTGDAWDGELPAVGAGPETGMTYPETSIKVDLRKYIKYRDTSVRTTSNGQKWIISKNLTTNVYHVWRLDGDRYVHAGTDANNDGWITEDEVDTGDFNGDGTTSDDIGYDLTRNLGWHDRGVDATWDSDHDKTDDIRARWVDGHYVFERKVGNEWKKMGEDTNGDHIIDSNDGGINWDLSADGATGQIGFHEGINLLGEEVLWDYQLAEMLGALKAKGVHIRVAMQQCFSGGLVQNLTGKVDKVCASSAEDKTTAAWLADEATKTATGLDYVNYYGYGFVNSLEGIDIASWNKAHQGAVTTDNARATALSESPNNHQLWEVTEFKTKTGYQKHDDGMYSVVLRLPQGEQIYDFEIIFGQQQPRWNLSLGEGIGFPENLPDGLDSELIPGGIRVFSDEPFGIDPLMVRLKAPEGTEITRIELTDANHTTIGYTTPTSETIPTTNPIEIDMEVSANESNDTETCDCTAKLQIYVEAYDSSIDESETEGCYIAKIEIFVDGDLVQSASYSEGAVDSGLELSTVAGVFGYADVGPGTHTVKTVVTNWYGQKTVREQEVTVCEGQADAIPVSQTNKVTMSATAPVTVQGVEPECTASMKVTWSADALDSGGIKLKAAWLRIDGQVVAASKPPDAGAPPNGYSFGLPTATPDPNSDGTTLGGIYETAVEPGSTVTIDIVAFGTDCRYYIAQWEKRVPDCPSPYVAPATPP